jgi:hypothetical protein
MLKQYACMIPPPSAVQLATKYCNLVHVDGLFREIPAEEALSPTRQSTPSGPISTLWIAEAIP